MPRDGETSEVVAALAPEPVRRRGRPPGSPRTPGSGRKPGKPNKTTAELREIIQAKGRPLELLCAIAAGRRVKTGFKTYAYPSLAERAAAARILMERVMPAPKPDADADAPETTLDDLASRNGSHPDIELARRIAHAFTRGERALAEEAAEPWPSVSAPAPEPEPDEPEPVTAATEPEPQPAPEPPKTWRHNPLIHGRSAIIDD